MLRNRPVPPFLFRIFLPILTLTTAPVRLRGFSQPFSSGVLFENVVFSRFAQVSTAPSLGGAGTPGSGFFWNIEGGVSDEKGSGFDRYWMWTY